MKTETVIVNLMGGPGVGKSTIAAGLYSKLKMKGISCELVNEVAKECTWEETFKLLENQVHIFSEQFRRQWRLIDKVDYVITDSPLILNSIYYDYYLERLGDKLKFSNDYVKLSREFFDKSFLQFNNMNIFVTRYHTIQNGTFTFPTWNQNGRNQNILEAVSIDNKIQNKLKEHNIEYRLTANDTTDVVIDDVLTVITDYHFQKNKKRTNEI